ncbi:MAG: sulfotransferase domain-containing protein [Alphaproteobacteria bacterium]|nr:sulfotransferase domain-containing protein [Alphaproteobacteria bacterium]
MADDHGPTVLSATLDQSATRAAFEMPDITGRFDEALTEYLTTIGARRAMVMFAFAPKAAGTFLRSAAIHAIDGQLMRVTHALGGRDGTPYLPAFILYYAGHFPARTLVTHIHMQALPANCRMLEAFGIRPIIMLRDLGDMLASYLDMLNAGGGTEANGLNCVIPAGFESYADDAKADFAIDILAPWYASYFASWLSYAAEFPDRVCVLRYREFLADPVKTLERSLRHSRVECSEEQCRMAVETAWADRRRHRFNQGIRGRGRLYFTRHHIQRLEHLLFEHYRLASHRDDLLGASTPCDSAA